MTRHFLYAATFAFALSGCATHEQPGAEESAVVGGCYNPVPDFERFVAQHATREEVEQFMGSAVQRVATEKALEATARSPVTPANVRLFRRYRSASISFMECDNQVVAFFDDTGHIIGYQGM